MKSINRLVVFLNSLGRGGAERVSTYLTQYFTKKNIKCYIITERTLSNEYVLCNNVERISLDINKNKYKNYISNVLKLRNKLKSIKPDIFLIMDKTGCPLAIPAAIGLPIKVVVSERNDPTHFSGKKITDLVSKFLMMFSDGYVFQTKEAKEFYKSFLISRGVVIPNPISSENLPTILKKEYNKEIVSVGRLTEQKNHKLLINAFMRIASKIPEYKLIIYGEGNLRKDLERLIESYDLSKRILLPGNKENVIDMIKDASVFVLSSDYEGMPNALIEAMALGIPSISTDCPCGGPRALIRNMHNGILVNVNDELAISNSIIRLLEDRDLMNKISSNSIKIRESLNINTICQKWESYLTNIMQE